MSHVARKMMSTITRWGLHHLAYAAGAVLASVALFLLADVTAVDCAAECPAIIVFSEVFFHIAIIATLASMAFAGAWIATIAHRTWQERIRIEALTHGQDRDELADIGQGAHAASPILEQARAYLWIGGLVGIPSLFLVPAASGSMGELGAGGAYALPIFLVAAAAGIASFTRGVVLLVAGRRLLNRIRQDAGLPPRRQPRRAQPAKS